MIVELEQQLASVPLLAGDHVTVEISPYDLGKGRLVFRHQNPAERPQGMGPQRNARRR